MTGHVARPQVVAGVSFGRWTAEALTILELKSDPDYGDERSKLVYEKVRRP